MQNTINPAAPHHLPVFITAPGETDGFLVGTAIVLVVLVLLGGSLYFRLHSLPERIAHGTSKVQFQLVAVLALLALFTHENIFWVAALLLALVPIPDFWTPLASMADSLAKMVSGRLRGGEVKEALAPAPESAVLAEVPAEVEAHLPDPREIAGAGPPESDVVVPLTAAVNEANSSGSPVPGAEGATPSKRRPAKRNQAASAERA